MQRTQPDRSAVSIRWSWLTTSAAIAGLAIACGAERATSVDAARDSNAEVRLQPDAHAGSQVEARSPGGQTADQPAGLIAGETDPNTGFAENAFPPPMPDREWHRDAWSERGCLRCHETGVEGAPVLEHDGMPELVNRVKCRTCHTLIPGLEPHGKRVPEDGAESMFLDGAFPPMIPVSPLHRNAWMIEDCLMCHADGTLRAPIVRHEGLPEILLDVKCRTCHVQVRAVAADPEPHVYTAPER